MGTKERRDREKHETRQLILDAARQLFVEVGFDSFTMRGLAERIEYTPTAIYHHFASKDALVDELCQTDFAHLAEHFKGLASSGSPIDRIRGVGEAYLDFALRHPNHYRFMFMVIRPPSQHAPEYVAETRGNPEADAYAFFVRAIEEAIAQGLLRPEFTDAHEVAQMLWGATHGLVSLHYLQAKDEWVPWRDLRTTARRLNDLTLAAIVREPAAVATNSSK